MMILLGIIVLLAVAAIQMQTEDPKTIGAQEAYERLKSDTSVIMLDVRTPQEYAASHVEGSLLIPVQELDARVGELAPYKGKTVLVFCRSGNRSGRGAALLRERGFNALNVRGGILDWSAKNLPLTEGK